MATVCGVTLVKKFTYRGDPTEEWSNQYWLTGSIPADSTAWAALTDALILQEKTIYSSATAVVRAYGYNSDAEDATAVYVRDLSTAPVAGTLVTTGGTKLPGDAAAWVRWKTSRLNARGKPIYLRKYFHDVYGDNTAGMDTLLTNQGGQISAFGTKLMDGSFLDARTIRSRLHSETILSRSRSVYVTTRTLKRRGKRPGS